MSDLIEIPLVETPKETETVVNAPAVEVVQVVEVPVVEVPVVAEVPQIHRKFSLKRDTKNAPKHVFASSMRKLPDSVDLRGSMPHVYDQGELGSCTANALAAAFEYNMICKREVTGGTIEHHPFTPSRLFIYYNERAIEGTINEDAGASIEDGVMSLKDLGVCKESQWPYNPKIFATKPDPDLYKFAKSAKVANYRKIPQTIQQLREALSLGYPICFGMQIYESFDATKSVLKPLPTPTEECLGGHAVCIVGYEHERKIFIVRNSWGRTWGDAGHFYLPYEYVVSADLCSDFWVLLNLDA